jgi:uncharacterized protein
MNDSAKLRALYAEIPAMTCKPGCTDCCGPVPFAKAEWDAIKDKREASSIDCPYSLTGRCDIYTDRPFLCRLFGTADDPHLTCPHGCQPVKRLTQQQAAFLMRRYRNLRSAPNEGLPTHPERVL